MRIIGFGGKARAGKDTAAEILCRNIPGICRVAVADELKRIAGEQFGWDGEKDERGRRLLQRLGEVGREYDPDIWIRRAFPTSLLQQSRWATIVVPDVRFPNEIEFIKKRNGTVIWIDRPEHEESLKGETALHASETSLTPDMFDYVAKNHGTLEDLHQELSRIILDILTDKPQPKR